MFCVFNHRADCFDCGYCQGKGKKDSIWNLDTEYGQEAFLEDLWQFIFSDAKLPRAKERVISSFIQQMLEKSEQQILENAVRSIV